MNQPDITESVLHVDLDSLLDTRLATLFVNNKINLNSKEDITSYFNRSIDIFPGVSFNEFKTMYERRDKVVLRLAIGTHINKLLKDFCFKTLDVPITTPWNLRPKICINTYPYQLTKEENDVIVQGVIEATGKGTEVYTVSMNNQELTPAYVKETFSIFIKYDLMSWMDEHYNGTEEEVKKAVVAPEICFIGPALFYYDITNDKEFSKYLAEGNNPFNELSKVMRPLLTIVFLPSYHFSGVITGINDDEGRVVYSNGKK